MNFYFTLTERVLLFGGGDDDGSGCGVEWEGKAVNEHLIACYTGSKTIKGRGEHEASSVLCLSTVTMNMLSRRKTTSILDNLQIQKPSLKTCISLSPTLFFLFSSPSLFQVSPSSRP